MARPTRITDEQKALFQRIAANPTTVTRAERNQIYFRPPPEEEDRLCREKVGLTIPELNEKVMASSDTLTETETDMIIRGTNYDRDVPSSGRDDFWFIDLPQDELQLVQQLLQILRTEYETQVYVRAYRRSQDFDHIRSERKAEAKKNQAIEQAVKLKTARPQWLHDMFDAKLPRWGFVIFRIAYGEGTDAKWQRVQGAYNMTKITVLTQCWGRAANLCVTHRSVFISDSSFDRADVSILRQHFKTMRTQNQIPDRIATDCFLIVDEAVLDHNVIASKIPYEPKSPEESDPWQSTLPIRAVNPDYDQDASASGLSKGDLSEYKGEITIPLPKVVDWLYYCFLAKSEDWEARYKATNTGPAELMAPLAPYPAYRLGTEPSLS